MVIRHFLDLDGIDSASLHGILADAASLKMSRDTHERYLSGRSLAMIFEKNSTRTRASFEVGMHELGGNPLVFSASDLQLGRGETIADTARVLSRYAHVMMMRANMHETVEELAHYADVPVINGLTDRAHPCQIMADLLTVHTVRGTVEGANVCWAGDGNNVLHSWISAAAPFGISLHIACPPQFQPDMTHINACRAKGAEITLYNNVCDAADGADVVTTDTWVSMGHENSATRRMALEPFQVNDAVMEAAAPDAMFLHCLPAHRGEEVTASVIDGAQSYVWDEAENRLHVQKAILCWVLNIAVNNGADGD